MTAEWSGWSHPLTHRPGTIDGDTLQACIVEDEYAIRGVVRDGDTVIDGGAYIGGFSALAASLGATVWAIEPDAENFRLLILNTATWAKTRHLNVALSVNTTALLRHGINQHRHIGSTETGDGAAVEVPARTLGEIMDSISALDGDPTIRVLKLDVEGAEFDAIAGLSAKNLEKIANIVMEIHPLPHRHADIDAARKEILSHLPGFRCSRTSGTVSWYSR